CHQDINWKNKGYTEKNFHDIMERAKNFVEKISAEEREALNAIKYVFSVMDADLDSMLLTASGVIDLTDLDSDCGIKGLSSILDPVKLMPSLMPNVGSNWESQAQVLVAHDLVEGL
ncbi:6924_t:CDS:2, partial [Paraglomus brasilianum]